jgi:hypothetical protein
MTGGSMTGGSMTGGSMTGGLMTGSMTAADDRRLTTGGLHSGCCPTSY